jgi:lysophospholipase L1-like esterase
MRILFQGDSITDAGRSREKEYKLGEGYAHLVEAALGFECPDEHEFINRGVSGNRVVDLYARIKKDLINLAPDVLSILIGVNDVWHEVQIQNGVEPEKFYKIYCMLIEEIRAALPDIKIMILEPFVLSGPATEEHIEEFTVGVAKNAEMARKVAEKYGLRFIPLQAGFDALCEKAPATYWLRDGVHPTPKGHEYIKQEWIKAFKTL